MSRISPISKDLFSQGNIIFDEQGILYNFVIKDKHIELRYFLTTFVVACIQFGDEFFMWEELTRYLEPNNIVD